MNLDAIPKPEAELANKRNWLIYQFVRYRNFHKIGLSILFGIDFFFTLLLFEVFGMTWWYPFAVGLFIWNANYAYDYLSWAFLLDFYKEMGIYIFPDETLGGPNKFDILMNRVGNFLSNPAREDLYKSLHECYIDLSRKEVRHDNPSEGTKQA